MADAHIKIETSEEIIMKRLLEDFIDDIEKDELTVSQDDEESLKEIKDDDEWEYAMIIDIQDDSKAMAVCHSIERYLESVIEVSDFAVDIYSNPNEACLFNMYNTSNTCMLIGFSLNKKFSTPYRVIIFLRYILIQADKLSAISGKGQYCMLVYRPEAESDMRHHLISRTVYGMLSFIRQVNGEREIEKKFNSEFRDCHRQLFDTCGWLTGRYVRSIEYIDEKIGYYEQMTQKLSKYTMMHPKKLKMKSASLNFLENHHIDIKKVYKTMKYVSAEFYLPSATNISDMADSGYVYSPQHVNDSDVFDARNALECMLDVCLHHVKISYEKEEVTWKGVGTVRLTAFLGAYPKMDSEEQSAENVFLMITSNRKCIDVLIKYLEQCLDESLPDVLTKDLFSIVVE